MIGRSLTNEENQIAIQYLSGVPILNIREKHNTRTLNNTHIRSIVAEYKEQISEKCIVKSEFTIYEEGAAFESGRNTKSFLKMFEVKEERDTVGGKAILDYKKHYNKSEW